LRLCKSFFAQCNHMLTKTPKLAKHFPASIARAMSSEVLQGKSDRYKGITIHSNDHDTLKGEEFSEKLKKSLDFWKNEEAKRTVWCNVDLRKSSDWLPALTREGFTVHHANPPNEVSMYKWLVENEADQIPSYAHHMIGVGGFVVNSKDEILVISERFRFRPHLKLPGGYVDPNEGLGEAAVREVFEETGVKTEFQSLLAFRHAHQMNFECSDIYFIVCLKPISEEIVMDTRELASCQWMPLKEYAEHELVHDLNRLFAKKYLEGRSRDVGLKMTQLNLRFKDFDHPQYAYTINDFKSD